MNRQEKISALLGDILIPMLGFFFWHWNLYFISLFFLLDQLAKEVSQVIRINKIKKDFSPTSGAIMLHGSLFIALLLFIHVFNYLLQSNIHFLEEMNRFFWYKDTGVPQGFILFPLLILMERLKFNMNMKTFTMEAHRNHWNVHTVQIAAFLILFVLLCLIQILFHTSQTVAFLCLISGLALVTLSTDKLSTFFPK
jgi:hypothetical protein